MKKRILSIALILCMVLSFVPQAVFANSNEDSLPEGDLSWEYDVWIGGTPVTRSQLAGPGWLFDPDTYTLTLREGFDGSKTAPLQEEGFTDGAAVIYAATSKSLTIVLESDITLGVDGWQNAATSNKKRIFGIFCTGVDNTVTITGSHRLNVYGSETAIWCNGLTVDGTELNCRSYYTAIKIKTTSSAWWYFGYTGKSEMVVKNGAKVFAKTTCGKGFYPTIYSDYHDNFLRYTDNGGGAGIFVNGSLRVENSTVTGENASADVPTVDLCQTNEGVECDAEAFYKRTFCAGICACDDVVVSGSDARVTGNLGVYINSKNLCSDPWAYKMGAVMARNFRVREGGTIEGFITNKNMSQASQGLRQIDFQELYKGGDCATINPANITLDGDGTVRTGINRYDETAALGTERFQYAAGPCSYTENTEATGDYNCYREVKITKSPGIYFCDRLRCYDWSFQSDFREQHLTDSSTIDLRDFPNSDYVKNGWPLDWGIPNIYIQSGDWTIIPPSADKVNYYIESGTQTIQLQDQREYAGGHIYIAENATVNIQGDGIGENWDISPIKRTATAGGAVRFISGTVKNAQADMANKVYILGGNINFNLKDYSQVVRREDGLQLYKDIYVLSPCTDRLTSIHTGEQIITPEESYYYPLGDNLNLVVWTVNDLPIEYVAVTQEDGETYNLIPGGSIEGLGSEYHRLVRAERYREFVPNPDYKFFRNPDESVTMNAAGSINTYENRLDSAFYGPYLISSTTNLDSSLRAEWSYQNDNGEKVVVGGNSLTCTIDDLSDIVNYRTYTCTVYEKAADGSEKAIGSYHAKVHVMRWEQPDTVYAAIGKEVTFTVNPSAETQWAAGFLSTLKWQVNKGTIWEDIPKSNTVSYTVTITEENAFYKYRRVVWGSTIGNFDKHEASIYVEMNSPELSVTFAPEITSQPQSIKIQENDTAKHALSVSANNAESYQWQKKVDGTFVDIEGATSSTLEVGVGDAGTYRCVVSNANGETVSEEASVGKGLAPSCGTLSGVKVTLGAKAQFNVGISNAPGDSGISVKWQYSADDGATWVDVVSANQYDNIYMDVFELVFSQKWDDGTVVIISRDIVSSSMTINKTTADMDGWKVRCVLTDAVGVYYSNTVELSIEMPDYTVAFDTDGGTEIASKTTVQWTDAVLDGVPEPTRDGWKFIGWKYGDVTVTPQTTYKELAAEDTVTSVTLTAQWKDMEKPVITGLENNKTYCSAVAFEASDNDGIASVQAGNQVLTAGTNGKYTLDAGVGKVTVVVTDKAGNETSVTVTVNNDHTYAWRSENGQYWKKCQYCGYETAKKEIPAITINGADGVCVTQDYKFSFTLPEGATDAVYGYAFENKGDLGLPAVMENNEPHGVVSSQWYEPSENSFQVYAGATTADGFEFFVSKTVALKSEHTDTAPKDHICDVCGATLSEHTGGEATCKDKAVCEYCGKEYGELDADKHTGGTEIRDAKEPSCTAEGYTGDTYCVGCGEKLSAGEAVPKVSHTDEVKDHLCDECGATLSDHTGGEATCTEKAVCEYCGKEYGKLDADKHTGGTEIRDAKEPSCTVEGYTGDTYCVGCGEKLSAGEAIPKVSHTDEDKDHLCDACGLKLSEHTDTAPKDHICDICGATLSEHTGGTVTCTEKAVCEYCNKPYGEPKGHNYKETIVQPNEFTMGATQHKCENCGDEYWVDFTTKDTYSQTVMPNGETIYHYCNHHRQEADTTVDVGDNAVLRVFLEDPLGALKRMEDDGIKIYTITEGAEQVVIPLESEKIVFRSDAPCNKFDQVMLNGLVLDKKYYSVTEGSTVVTLNEDFAKEIPTGMHLFGIISTDGVAITTFTVGEKTAADNNTDTPPTGDNSMMWLWVALLLVSGGLLTVTGVCVRKKKYSAR